MHRPSPLLAVALLVCAPATVHAQADGVAGLRGEYLLHYNAGHPDAVAAMFTTDAVLLPAGGEPVSGREAIREGYARSMAELSPKLTLTADATETAAEWAFERGSYEVRLTPADGEAFTVAGSYVTVARREGGAWKIAWLITNARRP